MVFRSGRHALQLPGPTNVPDRILRAMDRPTIDHRGSAFADMTREVLRGLQSVFDTTGNVFVYPSSATGAWEAALVNTLDPGDKVLMFDHGFFAANWRKVAGRLGLDVEFVAGDWSKGPEPETVAEHLSQDRRHEYKAVLVVHNETSTGVTSHIPSIRAAIDAAGHPALFMVDTVSSLASIEYHHDAWGVDVTVTGSQKGLMLPPGLGFTAASVKAMEANQSAKLPRSYWDWGDMVSFNADGFFPYTPATNMLFGLREALGMLQEEGLANVFARHRRLAAATRHAVEAWGLQNFSRDPAEHSNTLTAVVVPDGANADHLRRVVLDRFDMSLGTGLGKLKGKVFRIGHLGDFNDVMLAGTLCGIEMGLAGASIPFHQGGVAAALDYLCKDERADAV